MSKAADSDIRMMIATQVAYLDGDEGLTVGELVEYTITNYGNKENLGKRQQAQLDTARYIRDIISNNPDMQDCNSWIIKAAVDTNDQTGFYGCLIDTRDGEAIVGFRGSESFDTGQYINDWGLADVGLLNNQETIQQMQAREFTESIYKKYGNYYSGYNFTGHSLGGNLAEHATVTSPDGMPVHRCISYDGPGYSDEYIAAHESQIADRSKYIDHFQYSWCGALLTPLPGTSYQTIKAHNDEDNSGIMSYFWRHHTRNIEFDDNGNAQKGERDILADSLGPITKNIDDVPSVLWKTAPSLAVLWVIADSGKDFILEMRDKAHNLIKEINTTLKNLKSNVENWFRNMSGVVLTGEFEVNANGLRGLSSDMSAVANKIRAIDNSVGDIVSELRYSSISGSYYKSRLRSLSNALGRDADITKRMMDAMNTYYSIQ